MNVTPQLLYQFIGEQHVALALLHQKVADLEAKLKPAEPPAEPKDDDQ